MAYSGLYTLESTSDLTARLPGCTLWPVRSLSGSSEQSLCPPTAWRQNHLHGPGWNFVHRHESLHVDRFASQIADVVLSWRHQKMSSLYYPAPLSYTGDVLQNRAKYGTNGNSHLSCGSLQFKVATGFAINKCSTTRLGQIQVLAALSAKLCRGATRSEPV